jgi:DNA-directed RNA polymerase specialized sigma24 family protein
MRRVRRCVEGAELAVYERIIELYAPYVLVRCARYTNGRRQAQQIGVYTLITTCAVATELEHVGQLSWLVDIMVGVVGPDVVSGGEGEAWWGQSDELLIVDRRMRKIAEALNSLKRPLREVLVLHHVAGLERDGLARLLQRPVAELVTRISRAERLLAQRLNGLCGKTGRAGAPDVRSLLAQFAAGLDAGWLQEVADGAAGYLATLARRGRRRARCRLN